MEIPFSKWYEVIPKRRSRRNYSHHPIEPATLENIKHVCENFQPYPCVRAVLITESPEQVFKGAIGPYGKVKGAHDFVAFIGDTTDHCVNEKLGYLGEGIVLEATALNLATCWVGGFFRPDTVSKLVNTKKNERVYAITPVGYAETKQSLEERAMTGFGLTHRRKPLSKLVTGLPEIDWPVWIRNAMEASRLAPSALNRQPWRFIIEKDSITVSIDHQSREFNISKRLDCGITMIHIEVAAMASEHSGKWEFLESPNVAQFTVCKSRASQTH
ncbi:MAG: nitroreductase family protein [Chloroflexota bacterium]|nr:nitroreductase family protein [Chloroflexota bacterium]